MSTGRRRASRHRVRRHRPLLRAVLVATASLTGVAVVLAAVGAGFVVHQTTTFQDRATTIADAFPRVERPSPSASGALNILVLGSDSRQSVDGAGAADVGGGRSDTLMVVHVAGDRRSLSVMSIMRDSWVDVPGHGKAKINAAYSWGGVALTVQTVEQLLGVRIDHVAEIGFAGFRGMTDALGGVTVQSGRTFSSRGHSFVTGANRLDGDAALAFVRERYAFADGDRQRVRNQQAYLRGLADATISRRTLTSPKRISALVRAAAEHLSVDAGLTVQRLAELGWQLRDLRPASVAYFTLPVSGGCTSADGQSYVAVDEAALPAVRDAYSGDRVAAYLGGSGS